MSRAGSVVLFGWTNVGKSTLLNRLVGEHLAAVGGAAQTTRRAIRGVLHAAGGQIVFVDTPGLHDPRHRMNRAMVEAARRALAEVDLALFVLDAERGLGTGDARAAELLRETGRPAVAALNKVDRVWPKTRLLPQMRAIAEELGVGEVVPISARSGEGCAELVACLLARLPEGPPLFPSDVLTDQSERSIVEERIREKLLDHTRDELPHATAVGVERWHERADGLLEIDATIWVDRESQKPIVIGQGGELLKRVGSAARAELETFLARRIHLKLWVEVSRGWRDDERRLGRLGLGG